MRVRFLALLLFMVPGCAALQTTSHRVNYFTNDLGEPVTWGSYNFPLPVYMDEALTPAEREAVHAGVQAWNFALDADVFATPMVVEWVTTESLRRRPGVILVSRGQLSSPRLAETHWTVDGFDGTRFVHVDITLDPDTRESCHEIVMTHEFGHALGLDHDPDDSGSVMHPQACRSMGIIRDNDVAYVRFQLPF